MLQNYVPLCTAFFNEFNSINHEIISIGPSNLPEVILYSDKKLNDKSNNQILCLSIILKIHNNLKRCYFENLKVLFSTR